MYKCVLLFSLVTVSLCGMELHNRLPKPQQKKKNKPVKDDYTSKARSEQIKEKSPRLKKVKAIEKEFSWRDDIDWFDECLGGCLNVGIGYLLGELVFKVIEQQYN